MLVLFRLTFIFGVISRLFKLGRILKIDKMYLEMQKDQEYNDQDSVILL